jgi:hemerythrin-like metal-binding protein
MPAWESGHPQIDEQHRKLVDLANSFLAAALQPESQPADAMAALERLLENLARHFAYEEKLLSEAGYPGAADHAPLHARTAGKNQETHGIAIRAAKPKHRLFFLCRKRCGHRAYAFGRQALFPVCPAVTIAFDHFLDF